MSVENLRSVMHIDPKEDVLYSIPDSDNHGDLLIRPQGGRMINELGEDVYKRQLQIRAPVFGQPRELCRRPVHH